MSDVVLIAGVVLWVAWSVQAVLCMSQVERFARRRLRRRRTDFDAYRPPAVVIVPFKGLEVDLEGNVRGLFGQDYPSYRLLFVVDSEQDPAFAVLRSVMDRNPQCSARIIVAGPAGPGEGQKVHNLLAAIEHLNDSGATEEVWAFADSDAVPGPEWLGDLVGPLFEPEKTAVTTGYRWLVPVGGPGRFWAQLASVLNSSAACFYGYDILNHVWGGSMAMQAETARRGDLVGWWRGALSDDYQVSRMCRAIRRRVYFVPRCLVAAPVSFGFQGFLNFAYRQHVITRLHAPKLYGAALATHSLYVAGWVSAWACLFYGLIGATGYAWSSLAGLAIAVVFIANQRRSNARTNAVRNAFGPQMVDRLRGALRLDRWATTLWMTIHWLLLLRAGFGRTIDWRGIRYRLHGPQEVERLGAVTNDE